MKKKLDSLGSLFLQQREGFSSVPYLCSSGVPTIGFGNTFYPDGRRVTMKDKPITRAYAVEIFNMVVAQFENDVNSLVKSSVTQNQYNAILSFAYNVGTDIDVDTIAEGLGDSTLLKLINANPSDPNIAKEFAKWNKSNGKVSNGLISRRQLEAELYFKK
ncbi:lysozyme [Flavobacterium maritimum]|uniref:lysozyme n=1 Tax=Flavobacterium maritimum TaxID=3149042 RepID=UPI0032B48A8D